MNVVLHTVASVAIGCVASDRPPSASRLVRAARLACVTAAGVLSHGVLDGLKHQYPLAPLPDVLLSLALFGGWLLLVRRELRLLFTAAFLGAILPDLVDLGPRFAARILGLHFVPWPVLFPWHTPAGSGSIFDGRDRAISLTNHVIVLGLALAAILLRLRAVLGVSGRRVQPPG